MKIRALATICGSGDKRAAPGEEVDTKFLGISDEEARVLIQRGFAADVETVAKRGKAPKDASDEAGGGNVG